MQNITVVLIKDHTHAGVKRLPGETIEVDQDTANWLTEQRVGEVQRAAKVTESKPVVKPLTKLEGE